MARHQYITDPNNLFEDDVDDETFLRNSRKSTNPFEQHHSLEEQKQSYIERRREIEERTLHSTQKSVGLLRESEQIGVATAEELSRQREQLERTDKRLDEINASLRVSQKHINNIKSVFAGVKSYLLGKNDGLPKSSSSNTVASDVSPSVSASSLNNVLGKFDKYESHPATRLRDDGASYAPPKAAKDFTARLDSNLEEISDSVARLKGLAEGLSLEIDQQNDLIDNIHNKTEHADLAVSRQNKEMNRILKK